MYVPFDDDFSADANKLISKTRFSTCVETKVKIIEQKNKSFQTLEGIMNCVFEVRFIIYLN